MVFEECSWFESLNFKVHKRMEFNSFRKRMSIVVTDLETNKIKVYSKGADSEILKRLSIKDNS